MSDTTPQTGNGSVTAETLTLPEDVLSRIVSETERAFAARAARPSPIHLRTWEEIERFAEKAARSGMVPKDYVNKPDAICIAVQMGSELGLAPMQALQNIAVVNGRPSLWGDAMLALVRASGLCREVRESFTGQGDTLTAVCVVSRKDQAAPIIQSFSVAQAKQANLWGKNVWAQYPERMLQMRARGFGLRDGFPDVLRGLISTEEARDIPWEDTGLPPLGAPPVATTAPIKPPEAPKPPPAAEAHTPSQWFAATVKALQACAPGWEYQRTLLAALDKAPTLADVIALGDLPGLQATIAGAPPKPRDIMNAAFADARTKFERAAEVEAKGWNWDAPVRDAFPPGLQDKDLRNPAP